MVVVLVVDGNKKIRTLQGNVADYAYVKNQELERISISHASFLGERAFFKCKNLKTVHLQEGLTEIRNGCFSGCSNLEEIVIPKTVKKIGFRAFADCRRLKRVIIPEGVKEIDWAAFAGCSSLEEIVLPNSLKKIPAQLFLNCKNLKKVTLPENTTYLPDEFFKGCEKLNIVLDERIKTLGSRVFDGCCRLTNYPKQIEAMGEECFRNCRGLKNVCLNQKIEELNDGSFEGCSYLEQITRDGDGTIPIGKRCFKNCTKLLEIPDFVSQYQEQAFENCCGISEITITDSVIPFACFRGCQNIKTIHNQEKIKKIGSYAFSRNSSLEQFNLENISDIGSEAFSHCHNLKNITLCSSTTKIGSRSFYDCRNLESVVFPEVLEEVGKEAFRKCPKIKAIYIPSNLKIILDGAFAEMDSLVYLDVSPHNKNFITPDHKILIQPLRQKLVLYAAGLKDKSYSLKDYNVSVDSLGRELIQPIAYIGEKAFAGAKNLEEITICACTQDIERDAFEDCPNLTKLHVESIPLFTCPGFHIRDHGKYYFKKHSKKEASLPFTEVYFHGELVMIYTDALRDFEHIEKVVLPTDTSYSISNGAFISSNKLGEVFIPNGVSSIAKESFPETTTLNFENGLTITGLQELEHNDQYIGDYKLYTLADGTYYIEQNGKISTLSKNDIDGICSHSEAIRDNPILFLDFMNDLFKHNLDIPFFLNGILMKHMSLENRKIFFETIVRKENMSLEEQQEFDRDLEILKNSGLFDNEDKDTQFLLDKENFLLCVRYMKALKKFHVDDRPILCHKILMRYCDENQLKQLVAGDLGFLEEVISRSNLLSQEDELTARILSENCLDPFMQLFKDKKMNDRFLLQKPFIALAKGKELPDLFQYYDANMKRLFIEADVLKNNASACQNIKDLYVLLRILGAFEEDPIVRQRAMTFITEKILAKKLPNGEENPYCIAGDDIHRVFNFPYLREEFDGEFVAFFLEHYREIIAEEKEKAGFIQRIYLNFREISKTSTSNKGEQRKLKVTMKKCKNYLSEVKFDGVNDQNKDFAKLIGAWYDNNLTWIQAQKIYHESLQAPRNIFTKVLYDEKGNAIYNYDPALDLREENQGNIHYEWLPKQDYHNLVLGKYCSCCAHLEGVGKGIMRASMVLDCCQNLVIRDKTGEIISKGTIYVNKEEGYAVFNTVETSLNHRNVAELKEIYEAFMRGTQAFFDTYNKSNPDKPLTEITVGSNRNTLIKYLDASKHPTVPVQEALNYGQYSITGYGYHGDWNSDQKLLLKKKEQ